MNFSATLLSWYAANGRALPWRATTEPYKVWLSEVLLQQTRVEQGLPYYERFVQAFPTVQALAAASDEQVMKLWQGLGYYSRCRNLHHTAKVIAYEKGGVFPSSYKEWLAFKGVGAYTAAAVASICFNEAVAVVDGNVYRVLSRFFGVETPTDTTDGKKQFQALATELLPKRAAGQYNQAIMDFGALCCTPTLPQCTSCPLQKKCVAFALNRVKELPIKRKRVKVKRRYLHYIIEEDALGAVVLYKRTQKDIWQGLYEFSLLETPKAVSVEEIVTYIKERWQVRKIDFFCKGIKHQLTHQLLFISFWRIKTANVLENALPLVQLDTYPMPKPLADVVQLLQQ